MDAFTSRALTSSRFTLLLAQFIKTRMDVTTNVWRLTARARRFPSVKLSTSWPHPPPSSSSSDESNRRKRRRKHEKASLPYVRDHTNKAEPKDRYSIASWGRDTRTTSTAHDFVIPTSQKVLNLKNFHNR